MDASTSSKKATINNSTPPWNLLTQCMITSSTVINWIRCSRILNMRIIRLPSLSIRWPKRFLTPTKNLLVLLMLGLLISSLLRLRMILLWVNHYIRIQARNYLLIHTAQHPIPTQTTILKIQPIINIQESNYRNYQKTTQIRIIKCRNLVSILLIGVMIIQIRSYDFFLYYLF